MRTETELDELLGNPAGPSLVEGPHRAALKEKLITTSRKASSPMTKQRAGIILASILAGAGAVAWATQQAWQTYIVEESDTHVLDVQPDGKVLAGRSMVTIKSSDPNFSQAQADEEWAQVKQAIAEGNYRLRATEETNGVVVYLYNITLSDGTIVGFGSSRPMEESEFIEPLE